MENRSNNESEADKDLRLNAVLSRTIERVLKTPARSEEEITRLESSRKERGNRALETLVAQVGSRYAECRFSNWKDVTTQKRRVKEAVMEWASTWTDRKQAMEGLLLYGPVGTGKDHLAFSAVRQVVVQHRVSVKWLNGRSFIGDVRDRIEGGDSERELILGLATPEILVLSDPLPPIGDLTQHQADMLYRVIDARYAAGRITVCTLNVADDDEADRRLSAPTWDRLCDRTWKIACMWETNRKPAREIKP